MVKVAVYPGTFDPVTTGHLDIIARALPLTDKLIIGVAIDANKNTQFCIDTRIMMIKKSIEKIKNFEKIETHAFKGLLVEFAHRQKSTMIIRGLRAVSDFEFEFQMAAMNRKIAPDIETVFLMASDKQQFISSRFIKEIHRLGGDVSQFVDASVLQKLDDST